EDHELEAHYMYMEQFQEVSLDAADSGPIFDDEPLQKVSNDDHYNVFSIESAHPEQSKSVHNTYPIEQDAQSVIIDSLDKSCDREEIDQNDDDNDLAKEQMKNKLFAHQETISTLLQQKEAQIKLYKTHKDKELDKVIELEHKFKVLDNIVYKTGQSVQTMNMLNNKCRTSFEKPEFLKKAQRANPRLYDIGCYNDNLALMLAADSDKVIRLEKESRSKLSDLIRPFDYNKLNNLYDLLVPQRVPLCQILRCLLILLELVKIILFIVNSGCSKHMTGNLKLLINFVEKFLGTVKFGNDQIAPMLSYGDLVQGAIIIKWVYYVEGLNHNLFFVGQFCDADLEVAFGKSTCYIRDLKGNDLLTGSRCTDLYSITLQDTNCPNLICLMAKATSSQAWLWHRRLSHLNFNTINLLSKNDIVNCHKKGHFARECRSPKDPRRPGAVEPQRSIVPVKTLTSNALVFECDGTSSYDWSYQVEKEPVNFALVTFSRSSSDNETGLESIEASLLVYKQNESVFEENIKLLNIEVQLRDTALVTLKQKLEKAEKDRDHLKLKLEKFQTSSKNLTEFLASQTSEKTRLGYNSQVFTKAMFDCDNYYSSESDCESWPPSSLYVRFQPSGGYHAVPPPYIGTFMPPKPDLVFNTAPTTAETDHLAFNVQLCPFKPVQDLSYTTRPSAHIIEDWLSDFEIESEPKAPQFVLSFAQSFKHVKYPRHTVQQIKTTIPVATPTPASPKSNTSGQRRNRKACFVCKSVDHLIKDYDFHTTKMAQPTQINYAHRGHHKQY
nr:integrase, catalytic region, zinc finger, CCHC-type, peptidase aspartic, catalytic [Tanacetum cinerariifolium]